MLYKADGVTSARLVGKEIPYFGRAHRRCEARPCDGRQWGEGQVWASLGWKINSASQLPKYI